MSVLRAHSLTKSFLLDIVFSDLSFEVAASDRIALVGPNGCGKSTLLRIVAGLETADAGEVYPARGLRIGYQPQEAELGVGSEVTLRAAMLTAFDDVLALEARLGEIEGRLAEAAGETLERLMAEYARLEHEYEVRGGYDYETRIEQVLMGLGFTRAQLDEPVAHLSGGQRTRAALGRVLLGSPDLLLLDEPTNHLDIEAREWLEEFLAGWHGAVIVVAHDRYFLDKVVNQVWDLEYGRLERYPGNYSKYEVLREERRARQLQEWAAQQREIARTEEFIRRYKNSQKSREARGREKRLNRLERLQRPDAVHTVKLDLKGGLRSGDLVLAAERLEVGYRERDDATGQLREERILRCPDLVIRRGERVALIGPNGSGKTTLLKTLVGQLWPLQGEVSIGPSVRLGYYAQTHEGLRPDRTVLEEVLGTTEALTVGPARNFLARYLFTEDDVFKRIGALSGGERSRVALAKLELGGANFLILDEPTNHLDLRSQAALQAMLADYAGTILFVSHDRWLIDALATQCWWVNAGEVRVFQGSYAELMELRREQAAVEAAAQRAERAIGGVSRPTASRTVPDLREHRRGLDRAERRIAELEARKTEIERALACDGAAGLGGGLAAAQRYAELGQEHSALAEQLEALYAEWAHHAERLEAAQSGA